MEARVWPEQGGLPDEAAAAAQVAWWSGLLAQLVERLVYTEDVGVGPWRMLAPGIESRRFVGMRSIPANALLGNLVFPGS